MTDYLHAQFDWRSPEIVAVFDDFSVWAAPFAQLMLKHLPLRPRQTVLDLGCGPGVPTIELAQRLGSSCKVIGLDLMWWHALLRAQQKMNTWKLKNVSLVCADGASIPLEDTSVDLIVSNLGVNNFDNPARTFAECARVLRPGGLLALTTNLAGHMQEFYDIYAQTLRELNLNEILAPLEAHIRHRGSEASLRALLTQAGFDVLRVIHEPFSLRFLNGSALLRHSNIELGFLPAWRGLIPPEMEDIFFTKLEHSLNEHAARYNELAVTIPACYVEARLPG